MVVLDFKEFLELVYDYEYAWDFDAGRGIFQVNDVADIIVAAQFHAACAFFDKFVEDAQSELALGFGGYDTRMWQAANGIRVELDAGEVYQVHSQLVGRVP